MSRRSILLGAVTIAAAGIVNWAAGPRAAAAGARESELIAVLESDAGQKEKVDACRELAVIGGHDAVAPLAALLGDEQLAHMARYALEPNPDPAVNEALRAALKTATGLRLVGVINSLGVRRDDGAVAALAELLRSPDTEVAQATARALGSIGTGAAARALRRAAGAVPAANRLAIAEGMLRCAETLAAAGRRDRAMAIYARLRAADAPHQVRGGALRGAILAGGAEGLALLREHLRSGDYILFSAAVQTAQELQGEDAGRALVDGMDGLSPDQQVLVIQALGKRADSAALPKLLATARAPAAAKPVRLAAIRALPEFGDASAVAPLDALVDDADKEVAQAAHDALAALVQE